MYVGSCDMCKSITGSVGLCVSLLFGMDTERSQFVSISTKYGVEGLRLQFSLWRTYSNKYANEFRYVQHALRFVGPEQIARRHVPGKWHADKYIEQYNAACGVVVGLAEEVVVEV